MVGSKNRNYHHNHGCSLVEIVFKAQICLTVVPGLPWALAARMKFPRDLVGAVAQRLG